MYSGSHQPAHTNQGHKSWQAFQQRVGASVPGKCPQGAAPQKLDNRSSWNRATLSWRSSSANEANVVLDDVQRSSIREFACGAVTFTLRGPLSIVVLPIV